DYKACQDANEKCKDKVCKDNCYRPDKQPPCDRLLYDQICGRQECKDIADSSTCNWSIKSQDCADLTNQAVDCLTTLNENSDCARCFQEIDPDFKYEFIAKSRESVTLIWEMGSTPSWVDTSFTASQEDQLAPAYYLYTRVKVFDAEDPNKPVYISPVHQKYLGAAFSVFCAGHIDAERLKQGHKYAVRVYYYLTDTSYETKYYLKLKVNNLRITLVRIRE
ncbi:MAG: hypothetical protein PHT59_06235, partial [Candidatus Omnitrophica bacterium]|nr:hypothetical protein [Candidatus Omnitrophota bacterium]